MPRAEDAGLVRACDRNVGWCRFWLGVSLAIATLTFTFAVDQVFDVPIEPLEVSDTEQKVLQAMIQEIQSAFPIWLLC